jgi:type I restriction enzyme S subunit
VSFPRYEEYKDSGADWLGEVPSTWKLKPLWTLFRRTKRQGFVDEQLLSIYRDFGVVPKASRDDNNNKASDDLEPYQLVTPGDLAINKMKAWQGSVGISQYRGIVSPAYFVYQAIHTENPRYLHYLLRSDRYIVGYLSLSKGIRVGQWDLEPQDHSRMPVVLPSKEEQDHIAHFLDHETTKIDALVEEQQRLIELLKEKRQAVISHAVTRGLNPATPMKDSGVAWLGEVPRHWQVTRLKHATSHIIDCPHDTPLYSEDGAYVVIRTADLSEGRLELSKAYRLDEAEYRRRTRRGALAAGDIVYVREGERWGHAALVPEFPACCLGQRMMQFRPSGEFDAAYMMWALNSDFVYRQGQVDTVGATSPHVNVETICNYILAQPPYAEQVEIARSLNRSTARFDALIAEAESLSLLLQERRTALISAAVTGKIDVRSKVPHLEPVPA